MKLMVCVVQNRYKNAMEDGLKEKNYRMTELASNGTRRRGSTTFLIGIHEEDADSLQNAMKEICLKVEEKKGRSKEAPGRFTSFLIDARDSMPFLNNN